MLRYKLSSKTKISCFFHSLIVFVLSGSSRICCHCVLPNTYASNYFQYFILVDIMLMNLIQLIFGLAIVARRTHCLILEFLVGNHYSKATQLANSSPHLDLRSAKFRPRWFLDSFCMCSLWQSNVR